MAIRPPQPTTALAPANGRAVREGISRVGAGPVAARRWLITCAVMLGTFLAVMDVTVVNVSLPHMMGNFGQSLSAITWVVTSYSIA